ncbi:hypothetical protein PaecuDRAFT_1882 [Paenibacillus curdlanolyticus YK9]|uniref:Uncharacterized protein n=1 Tax=Paenibacillus curdlanolyticus YK9 TaxID=717606 RepID=E0I8D1_9BACL|nr:hypothetical protein PaecuDRAFT_1882 [Paenibacillus curdlanolyticus YK9]
MITRCTVPLVSAWTGEVTSYVAASKVDRNIITTYVRFLTFFTWHFSVVSDFLFSVFIKCRGKPNEINKFGSILFYHLTVRRSEFELKSPCRV